MGKKVTFYIFRLLFNFSEKEKKSAKKIVSLKNFV